MSPNSQLGTTQPSCADCTEDERTEAVQSQKGVDDGDSIVDIRRPDNTQGNILQLQQLSFQFQFRFDQSPLMDPSLLLAPPVLGDIPTSPNDLPVATLIRLGFGDVPPSTFPLYRGRNLIGTNPFVAGVFIPWGFGASEIHVIMDIDEGGLVAVTDPTPRQAAQATRVGSAVLVPGFWMNMVEMNVLRVQGIFSFHLRWHGPEELGETRDTIPRNIVTLRRQHATHRFQFVLGPRPRFYYQ
ncbi:MAG: hypothetical protein J3Q66DRAFT_446057 [Benniella sp.]|nr:MAG: hypothetical protein J3Q66DRAFT_446057 [Benniella sp.]